MLQTDEPRRPPEKDQGALWLELLQRLPALTRALGVLHERSTGLGGWTEVWRSLRLGGGYDYPTHYDGINNFLVHLSPTGAGASRSVLASAHGALSWKYVFASRSTSSAAWRDGSCSRRRTCACQRYRSSVGIS